MQFNRINNNEHQLPMVVRGFSCICTRIAIPCALHLRDYRMCFECELNPLTPTSNL